MTPGVPERVVASADGSKVRFILKLAEMVCNCQVHQTNYPDVYLMETTHPDGTQRQDLIKEKLPKGEARLSLLITNRNDALFHSLRAEIRKECQSVWADVFNAFNIKSSNISSPGSFHQCTLTASAEITFSAPPARARLSTLECPDWYRPLTPPDATTPFQSSSSSKDH